MAYGTPWESDDNARASAAPFPSTRILLVEDDEAMRTLLTGVLRDQGHLVVQANDGLDATRALLLDIVDDSDFDLVITDHRMPGLTGLELVQTLAACRRPPPILMLSAFADDALEARALAAGATAVMAKPFDLRTFLTAVQQLTG